MYIFILIFYLSNNICTIASTSKTKDSYLVCNKELQVAPHDANDMACLFPLLESKTPGKSHYVEIIFENAKPAENNEKPHEVTPNAFLQEFIPKTDITVEQWSKLMTTTLLIKQEKHAIQLLDQTIQHLKKHSTKEIKVLHYSTNYPHKKPFNFAFGEATIVYSAPAFCKNPARTEVLYIQTYSHENNTWMMQYTIALNKNMSEKKALEEIKLFKKNNIKLIQCDDIQAYIKHTEPIIMPLELPVIRDSTNEDKKQKKDYVSAQPGKTIIEQKDNTRIYYEAVNTLSNKEKHDYLRIELENIQEIDLSEATKEYAKQDASFQNKNIRYVIPKSQYDQPESLTEYGIITEYYTDEEHAFYSAKNGINFAIAYLKTQSSIPIKILYQNDLEKPTYKKAEAICLHKNKDASTKEVSLIVCATGPLQSITFTYSIDLKKDMTEAQAEKKLKKMLTKNISMVKK